MATSMTAAQFLSSREKWVPSGAGACSDLFGDVNSLATQIPTTVNWFIDSADKEGIIDPDQAADSVEKMSAVATRVSDLTGTLSSTFGGIANIVRMVSAGRSWMDLTVEKDSEFQSAKFKFSSYVAKVLKSVASVTKKILSAAGVASSATKVVGYISTSFSTLGTILGLVPKVIDLADNIKARKALDATTDYVSDEDNRRLNFASMVKKYKVIGGDIDTYMMVNATALKGPPMTRQEAADALKKKKKAEIESTYGKKTFEKLQELLGDQVTGEGALKADIYDIDIDDIKDVIGIAKKELDKTIKIKLGLAITGLAVAIAGITGTVATIGLTDTVINTVLLAGVVISAVNDAYSWYTNHIGAKIDLKEKISFSVMLGIIAASYAENTAENGFNLDTTLIAAGYMLFLMTSALILQMNAAKEKVARKKQEAEDSEKKIAAVKASLKAGMTPMSAA